MSSLLPSERIGPDPTAFLSLCRPARYAAPSKPAWNYEHPGWEERSIGGSKSEGDCVEPSTLVVTATEIMVIDEQRSISPLSIYFAMHAASRDAFF